MLAVCVNKFFPQNFQISVTVSWEEETQTSDPRAQTKKIRPLPPPRNITITPLNPRLIDDGSQTMLSADVVVQWAGPGLEDLAKYEIKVTTDPNGLEEFGEFSKSQDSVAPGSTQLIKKFTEVEDDPQKPRIVVQVCMHAAQAGKAEWHSYLVE